MATKKDSSQQPTSAAVKPLKPRKFRSSCDACSSSKVKCDQGQPECLRCVNFSLPCNYSPSRRMGKPPASSRKLTNASTISASSANASSSESEQKDDHQTKKRHLSPPAAAPEAQLQLPTTQCDHAMFNHSIMETDNMINWQDDFFQSMAFDGTTVADVQLTAASLFDLSFGFTATVDHPQMQGGGQMMEIDGDSSFDVSSGTSRDLSYDQLQESPLSVSAQMEGPPTPPSSSKAMSAKPCSHSLDVSHVTLPSPYVQTDTSIDQVLIKNKAQIENAYALLECGCSDNPHFALTLALVCMMVLRHYEDVIGATSLSPMTPISASQRSSSEEPRIAITMGAYKIDVEDEERMRVQIVINELRKMQRLVDKYATKYCLNAEGGKRDGSDAIYGALEVFLRSTLTATLQNLLNKLEC
ncbi:hypothetical protein VTL71DRAFT_6033 [Oculimacula yallundae]|uniref:Zn(2)-C6 fungal-type domain-containing protein n=1 Tax=Oculimacula yallundae TaxID=86028 RepID=A0ABR4C0D2_9HELO